METVADHYGLLDGLVAPFDGDMADYHGNY